MVKQKMVMKLPLEDAKKRSRALKTAVGLPGVISVALDKDRIIVVGDGVDSVALTVVLRKKFGYVELLSVGSAEEKKDGKSSSSSSSSTYSTTSTSWQPASWPCQAGVMTPTVYETREDNCKIM